MLKIVKSKLAKNLENPRFYLFVYFDLVTLLTFGIVAHWFTCGRSLCSTIIVKTGLLSNFLGL